MGMNKVKPGSNMYQFLNDYPRVGANRGYTWNPIRGKCPHDCSYCYMKVYPQPELHSADKEMQTNLGIGNFIFVGSSTDMWAKGIPIFWISPVLKHCIEYNNRYLFQSKNPARFNSFTFPPVTILGTTIESNYDWGKSKAPMPWERYGAMVDLQAKGIPLMISIEPIMDFDLKELLGWIKQINPEFVSIGADSKGHKLPEPSPKKTRKLIEALRDMTKVYIKDNLNRLLRHGHIQEEKGKCG